MSTSARTLGVALVLLPALFGSPSLNAQLSFGGKAFGLMEQGPLLPDAAVATMPEVDAEALIAEDEVRHASGAKGPYRFGFNHWVDLGTDNSGTWHERANGDRIWRLAITCPGAFSINFQFHDFVVPEGGLVFVYNDMGQQLGAFMAASNPGRTRLGVTQLAGDRITVEYYEPASVAGLGRLRIGQVTHAYRDVFKMAKGFGDSGSCNINVICPEGDDWRDQIRSTAIITTGGNGFCTGTMINNCEEDGTPYFLTADHCLSPDVEDWVFRWNWDSPVCTPTENAPMDQTVSGCQLLVNSAGTDVALLRLNTEPPPEYLVYYSGWDKTDIPATSVVGIHHPAGDIKKISHAYAPVIEGIMSGAQCWQVEAWDAGTTEPGSSGSGLWNQNGLLVGQLFGGEANCSFNFNDFYGRFDISYPLLQQYLGDCGDMLQGLGDEGPIGPVTNDAAVTSITNIPLLVCGTYVITPRVTLKNNGSAVVTSITILYGITSEPPVMNIWTGSLLPGQTYNYDLPALTVPAGEHTLQVIVSSPNGQVDEVPANDIWTYSFVVNNPAEQVMFTLNTDNWGSDITWTLASDQGTILYNGGPYANVNGGQTIEVPFCLTNGCYTFTILDLFGDGICCANGNGSYSLINDNWIIHAESDGQYGAMNEHVFCAESVAIPEHIEVGELDLFPNPTNGMLQVRMSGMTGDVAVRITDGLGRVVLERRMPANTPATSLDLTGLVNGMYLLAADHQHGRVVRRVMVQR